MSKESHEDERSERNRERSREAHWQTAESGAEENEGGALDQGSTQDAKKGADDPQQD